LASPIWLVPEPPLDTASVVLGGSRYKRIRSDANELEKRDQKKSAKDGKK